MADNKAPAPLAIWHANARAGEGPFPNSHEKLFTDAIVALEAQLMDADQAVGYFQNRAKAANMRANRYRRQRNGLAVILVTAAITGYFQYREETKKPPTVAGSVVP